MWRCSLRNFAHIVVFEEKLQEIAYAHTVWGQQFARCQLALLPM